MPSKTSPFWTKRLGLALLISVALHFLLVKGLGLKLPDWWGSSEDAYSTINAVLVAPPKPKVVAAADLPVPAPKPRAEPPPPKKTPPVPVQDAVASPQTEPVAVEPPKPEENASPVQATPEEVSNASVEETPAPPVFVETEFAVSKGGTKGVMHTTYRAMPDGSYALKSEVEAKGLASLFLGKLKQQSEGSVTEHGLKPSSYFYQYGDKEDKAQRASFDWQAGQVTMQNGKKVKTAPLPEGTQDFLSFMYQFMFVPPLEQMQLSIVSGKKLGTYDYGFEGEETLSTKMGELRTVHIFRSRADSDEKTELWLAVDYHYLPVKVRQTEKDGDVIEQIATRISTSNTTPAP
jgi:hypothetical protein